MRDAATDVRFPFTKLLVIAAAGGAVMPEATAQFENAARLDPNDQHARDLLAKPSAQMLPAGATPERGPNAAATRAAAILPATERDAMITGMVEGLAKRLQSNPQDAGGWIKLIRSRVVMGNREQAKRDVRSARDAYKLDSAKLNQINANARELGPQNSPVRECR